MPSSLPPIASRLLRASAATLGPALIRGAARHRVRVVRDPVVRVLEGEVVRAMPPPPNPLLPAAVRVERARHRGANGSADQVAVTMWFRDPPSLPGVNLAGSGGGGELGRLALRVGIGLARAGVGLAGAAAVGAATVAASRLEAARQPTRVRRIR